MRYTTGKVCLLLLFFFLIAFSAKGMMLAVDESEQTEGQSDQTARDWNECYLNGAYQLRKIAPYVLTTILVSALACLRISPSSSEPSDF